jgi:hypothetical protein
MAPINNTIDFENSKDYKICDYVSMVKSRSSKAGIDKSVDNLGERKVSSRSDERLSKSSRQRDNVETKSTVRQSKDKIRSSIVDVESEKPCFSSSDPAKTKNRLKSDSLGNKKSRSRSDVLEKTQSSSSRDDGGKKMSNS